MGKVIKIDPYIQHYVYEKQADPSAKIVWKQFEKSVVDDVDHILEMARGERDYVKTQNDWEIFSELLNFFARRWPEEYTEFVDSVKQIRQARRAGGYSESKEIMYVGTMPLRLMKMVKIIFPAQQFDKKFIWKMIRKFPVFKVAGEGNMIKGGVQL